MDKKVVSPFPLLQLPENVRMNVLRNIERYPQIVFSLCSKKTKNLVRSLNLKVDNISVTIGMHMLIQLFFDEKPTVDSFSFKENENGEIEENDLRRFIPNRIQARTNYEGREINQLAFNWENPGFGMRSWVIHFLEIFNHSEIDLYVKRDDLTIESLVKSFEKLKIRRLRVCLPDSNKYCQCLLEASYSTRQLVLYDNPFQDTKSLHKLLMQNFDYLDLEFAVTFDDISIINSSIFAAYYLRLSGNELNVFVKNWMNGFNSRLEFVYLVPDEIRPDQQFFDVNVVLKNIKYTVAPPEKERIFNTSAEDCSRTKTASVKGGYDIQRRDGTKATIVLSSKSQSFEMCVWR